MARRSPVSVGSLALVFAGGSLGTGCRAALESILLADVTVVPLVTFAINLTGCLLLGLLLARLETVAPGPGPRRLRLLLGTGYLGGFTTYSTFAAETVGLLRDAHAGLALAYGPATLVLGLLAAAIGLRLGGGSAVGQTDPDVS